MNTNTTIRITNSEYRKKLLGCWIGKSVGGTLGGPYEGKPGPLSLTFYDPVPTEMLPNDDLDLQVVWLETIRRRGFPVNRFHLAGAWLENVHLWPDEYGVATRNLLHGIYPPASGAYDNKFTAGMGAAIRSELWACMAPGDPDLAVRMAREDACVDHDGDGLDAALFLTALESLAFVESDPDILIDRAMTFISREGRLAVGIADTRRWLGDTHDRIGENGNEAGEKGDDESWKAVREKILAAHAPQNWTDVVPNLCFIVLGWLIGGGDFGRSICTAVNCGLDTDCTGATLGALLGIIDPDSIGKDWTEPIGMDMVLSPGMVGMHHPDTLNEFSEQVAEAAVNALDYYDSPVEISGSAYSPTSLRRWSETHEITGEVPRHAAREALVAVDPLPVSIEYPEDTVFFPGTTSTATIMVRNPENEGIESNVAVSVPDGWKVSPATAQFQIDAGGSTVFELRITAPDAIGVRSYRNMLDLRFDSGGLSWTVSAGLPQPIPWRRRPADKTESGKPGGESPAEGWETVEASRHYQEVPSGGWIYETDVKIPFRGTFIFVTQGDRPATTYLDGEKINDYDGSFYVPAMHRNKTGSELYCDRGWHRVRIVVHPDGPGSELFFGIGIRASFGWITELEWRLPKR